MTHRTITIEVETDAYGALYSVEDTPIDNIPIALLHRIDNRFLQAMEEQHEGRQ